jgi:hypothetical protein
MSSFVQEFKKYQKQERVLTGAIVLLSVSAPVSFTWMMEMRMHWSLSGLVGVVFVVAAFWLHFYRGRVAKKLINQYETLDIGSVLSKKITAVKPKNKFVVTNRGYNHFYLRCVDTGEQVLVSKHRVREDFEIAN